YLIKSVIVRDNPSLPVVRFLCHALIRSKFAYGMPGWRPQTKNGFRTLDVIVTEPMRHCLRLPKSTCVNSLLVESRTLPMKLFSYMVTIKFCQRAARLPADHSTREIADDQKDEAVIVRKRPPLFALARETVNVHQVPPSAAGRSLQWHFAARHRAQWRQEPHGKLLQRLTNDDHDAVRKYALPEYLLSESRQAAATRAKLRFDRSTLKDTLRRQNIIKSDVDAMCSRCNVRETVEHAVFVCKSFSAKQKSLEHECQLKRLSLAPGSALLWLLGDVHSLAKADRPEALAISSKFLCSVFRSRPGRL